MSVRRDHRPRKDGTLPWIVDYRDAQGNRRHKTFDTRKDAKAWEARTAVAVEQGTHVPDRATVTVEKAEELWIATCEANGLERATVDAYKGHLKYHIVPAIGHVLLSKVTVPFVRKFEDTLREGERSPAMIKRVVGSLGAIIADAQERGLAAGNAVRDMRSSRRGKQRRQEQRHRAEVKAGRDYPTPEEIKAFLSALDGRWRPMLMMAALCGLRSSELRGLSWDAVDLTKRELRVEKRVDRFGKMGSPKSQHGRRVIPIPAGLAQALREWKLVCPRLDGKLELVFPNGEGNPESHANLINRGLVPAMLAAGVTTTDGTLNANGGPKLVAKYTGLHAMRHFFAPLCINPIASGGMALSPKEAQERLGHASIQQTYDTYGHLFPRTDSHGEVDAAERSLLG